MTFPTLETLFSYLNILIAVFAALVAAFWLSLVIWAFRDMRLRSRDPFAQILAAVMVATLPFIGILIYLILRPPETLAERYERALEEEALLQEIEERPRCHKCSRTIDSKWVVCPNCHVELKKPCVNCVELLDLNWGVCPFCTAGQPKDRPKLDKEMLSRNQAVRRAASATAAGRNRRARPTRVAPSPSAAYADRSQQTPAGSPDWPLDVLSEATVVRIPQDSTEHQTVPVVEYETVPSVELDTIPIVDDIVVRPNQGNGANRKS